MRGTSLDTASLYTSATPRYAELRGKTAIVTGSSKGIGKGIAIRLAKEGMKVVVNGRSSEAVDSTFRELDELGAQVLPAVADVSTDEGIDRLFDETLRAFGEVNLLVNNAATLKRHTFFPGDTQLLDVALHTNVRGPYLCAYRAAELMRDRGTGGSIINIGSVGGVRAHWRGLPYDVTKGALDSMTRSMALELAEYGIRVNSVAPGATQTERSFAKQTPETRSYTKRVPAGRFGSPLEMGAAVAFLASSDAAYIIGQILYVDGGLTIQLGTREQPT